MKKCLKPGNSSNWYYSDQKDCNENLRKWKKKLANKSKSYGSKEKEEK